MVERALPIIQPMDSTAIDNEDEIHPNRPKTIVTTPTTPFANPYLFEGLAKIDDTTFTIQFYCGYVLDDYEGFDETGEQIILKKENFAAGLFWTDANYQTSNLEIANDIMEIANLEHEVVIF